MGISTLYERNLFSEISVSEKTIKYKNIYFYVNFKNNKTLALKYSLRFFYFIKLCDFFKILNYNLIILLRLFNRYYKHTLWAIFLQNYNLQIFYLIVKKLIHLYNSYNFSTENFTTHNTELSSINFLFFNDFKNTSFFMNYNKIYSNLNLMLIQNIKGDNFKDCEKLDKAFSIFFYNFNYGEIYYTIHFLRVQRRYNKRRYSRVRAVSRPSFFAGISLSSILIAGFWNASIKSTDWLTSWLIVIDINLILFFFIFYYVLKFFKLYNSSFEVKKKYKTKIKFIINKYWKEYVFIKFFNKK